MKKKILFMLINMNVGGTEKALLNMISEIPKDKYDITIFMLEEFGGFLNSIPNDVHVKYFKGYKNIKGLLNHPPQLTALEFLKKGNVLKACTILMLHLLSKVTNDRSFFFKYVLKNYPELTGEYDVAVAYDGPMDFISYFILHKVKARKKLQWVHFDITKIGFNYHFAAKTYKKYDKVLVVSNEGKDKLISKVHNLKDKTVVLTNVLSPKMIFKQAKEGNGFSDEFSGLRLLTVGRLSEEKGQDIGIRVLAKLIANGFKVKWYCIGEGNLRVEYEKLIKDYNLEDKFVLLGADPNPYQYIDQCDIYVQTSRHEGYCIALAEARCLNKPIVTTDFTGAKEQIRNGETGLIVSFNEKNMYNAIVKLIENNEIRKNFTNNLAKQDFAFHFSREKINNIF